MYMQPIVSQVTRVSGCNNEAAALWSDHFTEVSLFVPLTASPSLMVIVLVLSP